MENEESKEIATETGELTGQEWDDTRKVLAAIIDKFRESFEKNNKELALAVVAWNPGHPGKTSFASTQDRPEAKKAIKRTLSRM